MRAATKMDTVINLKRVAVGGVITLGMLFISPLQSSAQISQGYAGTRIKNDTGAPLGLIDITDEHGKKVATLFIVGKEMTFDAKQEPIKGAGRVVAEKGKRFSVLAVAYSSAGLDEIRLAMGYIDWNDDGRVTEVRDLDPTIHDWFGQDFTIVSDVAKPTVKDGLLHVVLKGHGEIAIRLDYGGRGVPGAKNGGTVQEGAAAFFPPSKKPATKPQSR